MKTDRAVPYTHYEDDYVVGAVRSDLIEWLSSMVSDPARATPELIEDRWQLNGRTKDNIVGHGENHP